MSVTTSDESTIGERDPYTAPRLTRHGRLDELTQGKGNKQTEKGSEADGV